MSTVKEFKVHTQEVYDAYYQVRAKNKEEAIKKFQGEIDISKQDIDFLETNFSHVHRIAKNPLGDIISIVEIKDG